MITHHWFSIKDDYANNKNNLLITRGGYCFVLFGLLRLFCVVVVVVISLIAAINGNTGFLQFILEVDNVKVYSIELTQLTTIIRTLSFYSS